VPIQKITIQNYIDDYQHCLTIDVRSEGEFAHARIPNAMSLPLFDNAERATIGTTYKQRTKEKAIKEGLQFFGPKLLPLLEQVEKWQAVSEQKQIVVHCARGGMRSAAVCWLLDLYGYNVLQIIDGYKAFRNWALEQFTKHYNIKIIGGYTGSAKTEVLNYLQSLQIAAIDIEGLAHHKGSAFGAIQMPEQPSQEMFENKLALQLFSFKNEIILLEDESQRIGRVNIPHTFWPTMRNAQVLFLQIPFAERLQHIVDEYGKFDKQDLLDCIVRIEKNLGGLETKTALQFLADNDIASCFDILLKYYDKYYEKGLHKRENWADLKITIDCIDTNEQVNADKIKLHL
jgi:tRNA 2-selenouridine synthase